MSMSEGEPFERPSDESETGKDPSLEGGEELDAPTVPVEGDFEVRKVVRLPEDTSERDRIRSEYDIPPGRIGLSDASIDRPAINSGRRGRPRGVGSDD